jgi:hypothetical protein
VTTVVVEGKGGDDANAVEQWAGPKNEQVEGGNTHCRVVYRASGNVELLTTAVALVGLRARSTMEKYVL